VRVRTMNKKVFSFEDDEVKKGRHHQLPHRVTPTLVTPLVASQSVARRSSPRTAAVGLDVATATAR